MSLISCSSGKDFPKTYKGEQIHFGQGGGFTGAVTYFALLDNGRLFQRAGRDTTFTYVDQWDKTFVRQMMTSYHTLQFDKMNVYEPGDLYYFLQHKNNDGPFHRLTWGKNGFIPDPKLTKYFTLLYQSTKPKS